LLSHINIVVVVVVIIIIIIIIAIFFTQWLHGRLGRGLAGPAV